MQEYLGLKEYETIPIDDEEFKVEENLIWSSGFSVHIVHIYLLF